MIHAIHTVGNLGINAGGPSRTVPALCDHLKKYSDGLQVSIVTSSATRYGRNLTPNHATLIEVPAGSNTRGFMEAVEEHHRKTTADTILHDHGQWLSCNRASAKFAKSKHIPRVVTPRGMLSPWALSNGRLKKWAAWNLFAKNDIKSCHTIHATSALEAEELRKLGCRNPIAVIPNGVDICRSPKKAYPRKRNMIFMSRIHPKKGIDTLLRAWRNSQTKDWNLILAGPNETKSNFEMRICDEQSISYIGPVAGEIKHQLLESASVLILPSYSENFGVVVAEALLAGTPVITTHGTPWGILNSIDCGWWVPMNQVAIENAIKQAINTPPERLLEMGQRGRDYVVKNLSWQSIAFEMQKVYKWILYGGEAPSCISQL